jgi:CHAD domain-containing protein
MMISSVVRSPRSRPPLAARRVAAHCVTRRPTVELGAFVDEQLQQAERELARPPSELHSGIHEARKRLRKARATVRLAKQGFEATAGALDRRLDELCKQLSELRDAQAITETLNRLLQEGDLAGTAASDALPLALERRDALLRRALDADPAFEAMREHLRAVRTEAAQLPWSAVSGFDVTHGLSRSEDKVLTAYVYALAHRGNDEAWHQLRRRLRRLKHQSAMLSGESPMLQGSRFDDAMLQSLAHAQDERVLLAACDRHSVFPLDVRRSLRQLLKRRLRLLRKTTRRVRRKSSTA